MALQNQFLWRYWDIVGTLVDCGFYSSLMSILSKLHRSVFVGDVVMLKDPQNPEREIVRRVAALEGEEMESSDPSDEPFCLARGTCWVLCDNDNLSSKVPVWIYLPPRTFWSPIHAYLDFFLRYWRLSSSVYQYLKIRAYSE